MFAPFLCSRSQPVRILRVTGTSTAFTTACRMRATSVSSVSSAEPHSLPHTFFAGHPMFRSMSCAPRSTLARAASASACGSAPASCTTRGSGSPS